MKNIIAASSAAFLLLACTSGINLPDPKTPVLQKVNLHGASACPTINSPCPLPTTAPTLWHFDSPWYYNASGDLVGNRHATIVVDVPALTDLALSFTANGKTTPMTLIPTTYPGTPDQYGLQHTDAGETRTWFISVAMNGCLDPATFHIVDVGRKAGNPQSAPLDVTLKLFGPAGCQPSGPFPMVATSGSPTNPGTPGGGTATCPPGTHLIKTCSKCQASAGATPIYFYDEGCYASWQQSVTVHGNACTLTQVSGPSQCKLP